MNTKFEFSAGVWNLHPGADPFGPAVRSERDFVYKCELLHKLGFTYLQLHDDDAVPMDVPASRLGESCRTLKRVCDDNNLTIEFIAPRLWEDTRFADGGPTSNSAASRELALDRAKRSVDIAAEVGTDRIVLWPAREGTYIRESKGARVSFDRMLEYLNAILTYGPQVRVLGEMKPNEPMDIMYLPSTGHMLAVAYKTIDPSDEMAFAMWHDKLWGVHLNDQNGLKYDQDKTFGSVDLRRAFNQVDVLVRGDYGLRGEIVGLDVKAMRTQHQDTAWKHLANSKEVFERLVALSASIDRAEWSGYVAAQDYEGLEIFLLRQFLRT